MLRPGSLRVKLKSSYTLTARKVSARSRPWSITNGGAVLKGLGNLQGILRQALDVKNKIDALKDVLANERVEASSGGGMVKVVMTGKFEIESLKIDPEIINKDEPEMLETLVSAAINEAVRRTQDLVKTKMAELTGGMDIPGLT